MKSQIPYDDELMREYNEFRSILDECYDADLKLKKKESGTKGDDDVEEDAEMDEEFENKWIIRIEMDQTAMLDMNITNEDIHYTLKSLYGNDISCFYSDYNSDNKIVFRIRLNGSQLKKKGDHY